jgi:hypothetical protein
VTRYTIRYRATDTRGRVRLLVEDERGARYLFHNGRLSGPSLAEAGEDLAPARPDERAWAAVPAVAPYTLDELHRLTAPPARPTRAARLDATAHRQWLVPVGD